MTEKAEYKTWGWWWFGGGGVIGRKTGKGILG